MRFRRKFDVRTKGVPCPLILPVRYQLELLAFALLAVLSAVAAAALLGTGLIEWAERYAAPYREPETAEVIRCLVQMCGLAPAFAAPAFARRARRMLDARPELIRRQFVSALVGALAFAFALVVGVFLRAAPAPGDLLPPDPPAWVFFWAGFAGLFAGGFHGVVLEDGRRAAPSHAAAAERAR